MSKISLNLDQKDNLTPSTSESGSTDKDKGNGNQKMNPTDKLGTDGKLTLQKHQQHLDINSAVPSLQRLGQQKLLTPSPLRKAKFSASASEAKTSQFSDP